MFVLLRSNSPKRPPLKKSLSDKTLSKTECAPAITKKKLKKQNKKLFGVSLEEALANQPARQGIPRPLFDCFAHIEADHLTEEGLYRIPGSKLAVEEYQQIYDRGEEAFFAPHTDAGTFTSLVKLFLRLIPGSIFSGQGIKQIQEIRGHTVTEAISMLRVTIASLPRANRVCVEALMRHLHRIMLNSDKNLMNSRNLSMCIFPHLAGPVSIMIEHYAVIFADFVAHSSSSSSSSIIECPPGEGCDDFLNEPVSPITQRRHMQKLDIPHSSPVAPTSNNLALPAGFELSCHGFGNADDDSYGHECAGGSRGYVARLEKRRGSITIDNGLLANLESYDDEAPDPKLIRYQQAFHRKGNSQPKSTGNSLSSPSPSPRRHNSTPAVGS